MKAKQLEIIRRELRKSSYSGVHADRKRREKRGYQKHKKLPVL